MRSLTMLVFASAALFIANSALAESVKADVVSASAATDGAGKPAAKVKGISERFDVSVAAAHDAAIAALKMNGFDIKSDEPALVTGSRPHKIGLLVGSGGEKIKVTLTAEGDAATVANVNTQITFVGMAGQKNWDAPVIAAMKESLSAPVAAAPAEASAAEPEVPTTSAAPPASTPAATASTLPTTTEPAAAATTSEPVAPVTAAAPK